MSLVWNCFLIRRWKNITLSRIIDMWHLKWVEISRNYAKIQLESTQQKMLIGHSSWNISNLAPHPGSIQTKDDVEKIAFAEQQLIVNACERLLKNNTNGRIPNRICWWDKELKKASAQLNRATRNLKLVDPNWRPKQKKLLGRQEQSLIIIWELQRADSHGETSARNLTIVLVE